MSGLREGSAQSERQKCVVCEAELSFRWSDTHGVGVCYRCGMPYTVYHYENDKRVDKPPSPAIKDFAIPVAKRYWRETKRRVFPAAFDFMADRHGASYSGATPDDCVAWSDWVERTNPPEFQQHTENKP